MSVRKGQGADGADPVHTELPLGTRDSEWAASAQRIMARLYRGKQTLYR
jgi:hypothetical protein